MSVTLPHLSREYVEVPGIKAFRAGEEADPTGLPVEMAIIPQNSYPEESDWSAGEWVDSTTARILVGPGGDVTPAAGSYTMWLRITGATEQPTRAVGSVVIRP